MKAGEVHVWRVPAADRSVGRAALCEILSRFTPATGFARTISGKPYLAGAPEWKFNFAHSRGMALVAVAMDVEVGVDIERLRPMPEHAAIAERFFPPMEAAEYASGPQDAREFFRRWTRLEAILKAQGAGLYGAGQELRGEWTIQEIDAGEEFAAAVAAACAGLTVVVHDYSAGEK